MEGEAAVQAVHGPALERREAEQAAARRRDVSASVDEMRADYEHQLDARYAAARGFVDAIVYPEETRDVLALALRAALHNPGPAPRPLRASTALPTHESASVTESHRSRRRGAGLLGRLARRAAPAGRRRAGRLPDARLSRRSHDVHSAEAEGARPEHGLRARLRRRDGERAAGRRRARRARHRQRRRREPASRAPRRCATSRRSAGAAGKVRIGVVTGDDLLPRLDELIAAGHPLANMETGEPLVHRARSRAVGQRVHRLDADRRGARAAARTSSSPVARPTRRSRWRRCATSSAGAPTTGTGSPPASSPATSSSAARSAPAATASTTGATSPISRTSAIRSSRRAPTARSSSRSIRAPAGASPCRRSPSSSCTRWAIRTRTSRRTSSPTSRRSSSRPTATNRVRVFGIKGRPATDKLKVSIAYRAGFKAVGTLVYSWPDALEKAQLADRVLRERLDNLGLRFDQILTEFVGVSATHGPLAGHAGRRAGSAASHRRALGRIASGGRALHARDRAARAQRTAERHGLRRRPPEGRGDRRLLARARRQDASSRRSVEVLA